MGPLLLPGEGTATVLADQGGTRGGRPTQRCRFLLQTPRHWYPHGDHNDAFLAGYDGTNDDADPGGPRRHEGRSSAHSDTGFFWKPHGIGFFLETTFWISLSGRQRIGVLLSGRCYWLFWFFWSVWKTMVVINNLRKRLRSLNTLRYVPWHGF